MILVFLAELDKTASMSVIGDVDGAGSVRVSAFDLFAVTIVINLVKKEKKRQVYGKDKEKQKIEKGYKQQVVHDREPDMQCNDTQTPWSTTTIFAEMQQVIPTP